MRIVRIIARLNVGGPARHVSWLTAATARAGHESVLVAGTVPPGEDDMSYFAAAQGVEPLVIPEMSREISPKDALTVWKLYRLFRRVEPDIVHTHTAKAGTVGRVAGILYRWLTPMSLLGRPRASCRFVHTYHGHVFHSYYGALKTRIFLTIEKLLARMATDRIVVISPQQFREIHGEFGVGRTEQFAVIPLGLDTRAFAGWRERRHAARAEFGIDSERDSKGDSKGDSERDGEQDNDETLLVGIVGRLTEIKNHKLFLQAAARFKERYGAGDDAQDAKAVEEAVAHGVGGAVALGLGGAEDVIDEGNTVGSQRRRRAVRFVVIGDGQLRRALEDEAHALRLDDDVTFAGTRDDPENFYAALDVVVLTSLNEGTPLTLIEAMANERAVLATAVGGVVDLVGKNVDAAASLENETVSTAGGGLFTLCERGVLVGSGDAEGLAEGLARLVEDDDLRRELGRRGRLYVEQNYSVERLVADVSRLYDELTDKEKGKIKNEKMETGKWLKDKKERTSPF
ncbi:MAG TPA: glycosyltransferase [Pyrinomonadaceae bacterium]|jgi:glycosyltransferase involved in cell wall biosynthesis